MRVITYRECKFENCGDNVHWEIKTWLWTMWYLVYKERLQRDTHRQCSQQAVVHSVDILVFNGCIFTVVVQVCYVRILNRNCNVRFLIRRMFKCENFEWHGDKTWMSTMWYLNYKERSRRDTHRQCSRQAETSRLSTLVIYWCLVDIYVL